MEMIYRNNLKNKEIEFGLPFEYNCDKPSSDLKEMTIEISDINDKATSKDCLIAASSGIISSAINILWNKNIDLFDASNDGKDTVDKFVLNIAKHHQKSEIGSKRKITDLNSAIRYLEEKFPLASDSLTPNFGGAKQHHLRDFSHHASIVGLACSIANQFTGYGFGTDTDGKFVRYELPYKEHIGKDAGSKIVMGTLMWGMHLVSDMAGSSGATNGGTGIPGPILSFLKEVSVLPIVKDFKVNYQDKAGDQIDISFSIFISKLFNGTHTWLNKDGQQVKFDLRTELGIGEHILKGAIPVIANEAIVRTAFFITRLFEEVNDKNIKKFNELSKIDINSCLPFNNKRITRMLTISSGIFFLISTGSTVYKGAKTGSIATGVGYVLLNINYFGIGRFAIAVKNDKNYIVDDIVETRKKYLERQYLVYETKDISFSDYFKLSPKNADILFNLKREYIKYDIGDQQKTKTGYKKQCWLDKWIASENFTILSEKEILEGLEICKKTNHLEFVSLLLELVSFVPYYPLSKDEVEEVKGLKVKNNYFKDCLCKQGSAITLKEYNKVKKDYDGFVNTLKESKKKTIQAVGATTLLVAVTGGLGYYFAPEIAVAIAGGDALVGLHGAALTNASLALIGGGSIAAGGFGMAGGTIIISGGGTLLGMAGAAVSMPTLMSSSKVFTCRECAKILVMCKEIKNQYNNSSDIIDKIGKCILYRIAECEQHLEKLKTSADNDSKTKKAQIKNSKGSIKYLQLCNEKLKSL